MPRKHPPQPMLHSALRRAPSNAAEVMEGVAADLQTLANILDDDSQCPGEDSNGPIDNATDTARRLTEAEFASVLNQMAQRVREDATLVRAAYRDRK